MKLPRLVIASANPDKVTEIVELLGGLVRLDQRPSNLPEVEETGETLEENAQLKAVAICEATGQAAVADDTGLEVDALGGKPGVFSARYAGPSASYEDNVTRLLGELDGISLSRRTAQFRTVAFVCYPDGREVVAYGAVKGFILDSPRGSGGFGYDSIFAPLEGDGRTFAEMGKEKHLFSHRGRAFRSLLEKMLQDSVS